MQWNLKLHLHVKQFELFKNQLKNNEWKYPVYMKNDKLSSQKPSNFPTSPAVIQPEQIPVSAWLSAEFPSDLTPMIKEIAPTSTEASPWAEFDREILQPETERTANYEPERTIRSCHVPRVP
jgi:hypothetical protein